MRKAVALVLAALPVVAAAPVAAEVYKPEFKNSLATDAQTPWGRAAIEFADLLRERTQGRIRVVNHWSGELFVGKQVNEFGLLTQGLADFAFGSTTNWTPELKELHLFNLPFLFPSTAAVDAVEQGEPGRRIFAAIESRGAIPLAWGEVGFRELSNDRRAIRKPQDLAGLKIRVVAVPFVETFLALGALPVGVSLADLPEALRDGTLDGVEGPIANGLVPQQLWTRQRHLTVWRYAVDPIIIAVSRRSWDGLGAADREIVKTTAVEVAAREKTEARKGLEGSGETLEDLKKKGMEVVVLGPAERALFQEKTRALYARWAAVAGPELVRSAEQIISSQGDPGATAGGAGRAAHGELIYVSNEDSSDLTLIDAGSGEVLATIPVGKRPRGVQVAPDGSWVYVALSGSPKCPPSLPDEECAQLVADKTADGIAVVDPRSRRVERILASGSDPEQFDLSADGTRLYVSNEDANAAVVVDLATGTLLRTVPVGREPEGVRIRPDGRVVYVTSEGDHEVTAIDVRTGAVVARIAVGRRPRAVGFLPDGSKGYVSGESDGTVSVFDVATHRVLRAIALPEGSRPMGIAVAPDGSRVYVSNGRGGTVSVIDPASDSAIATIPVGARPWGIAVSNDGRWLYTANGPSDDVAVVDTERRIVVRRVKAGRMPWGIAVGPNPPAGSR